MERLENGVIIIDNNGNVLAKKLDKEDSRHWMCFQELERTIGITQLNVTSQMDHAWYLGMRKYISIQLAKDICFLIVTPEIDTLTEEQSNKLIELASDYQDYTTFGIDIVSKDKKHTAVKFNNEYEFGYNEILEIFSKQNNIKK